MFPHIHKLENHRFRSVWEQVYQIHICYMKVFGYYRYLTKFTYDLKVFGNNINQIHIRFKSFGNK